jgi:hypothetical protein
VISSYAVIGSDGERETCQGLRMTIAEAIDLAKALVREGICAEAWIATLICTTQAFTKETDGNLFSLRGAV